MATKIEIFATTNVGKVRDHNEDDFIISTNLSDLKAWKQRINYSTQVTELQETGILLAVADGLGGVNAGEIASKIAIQSIKQYFSNDALAFKKAFIQSNLVDAIKLANQSIINASKQNKEHQGMGTTLILGWLIENELYVAWVGDSRAYLYRKESGLRQISKDHSLVQELIDKGEITEEQAFYHPNKNIITQSLGDVRQPIYPGFQITQVQTGDYILLCSDGLNGMLTDEEISNLIKKNYDTPSQCGQFLVDAANSAGGADNITVALGFVTATKKGTVVSTKNSSSFFTWQKGLQLVTIIALIAIGVILFFDRGAIFQTNKTSSVIPNEKTKEKKSVVIEENEEQTEVVEPEYPAVEEKSIEQENLPTDDKVEQKDNQLVIPPKEEKIKNNLSNTAKKPQSTTLAEEADTKISKEKTIKEFFLDFRNGLLLNQKMPKPPPDSLEYYTDFIINQKEYTPDCCSGLRKLRGEMFVLGKEKVGKYAAFATTEIYTSYESEVNTLINKHCKRKGQIFITEESTIKGKNISIKNIGYKKTNLLALTLEYKVVDSDKDISLSNLRNLRKELVNNAIVTIKSPCRASENEKGSLIFTQTAVLQEYLFKECLLQGAKDLNYNRISIEIQIPTKNSKLENLETITAIYF